MTDKSATAQPVTAEMQLADANREIANLKRRYEEATARENANADKAERYRRAMAATSQSLAGLVNHCEAMILEVTTLTAKATWDQASGKSRQIRDVVDSALRSIA